MKLGEDPKNSPYGSWINVSSGHEDDISWKGRPIDKVDIKVSITTDQGTFDVTNLVEESAWCEMTDRLFETFTQIQKEESK